MIGGIPSLNLFVSCLSGSQTWGPFFLCPKTSANTGKEKKLSFLSTKILA